MKRYGNQPDGSECNDHVRGFPHTYGINEFGQVFGTAPGNGWQRGDVVRATQPAFALRPPMPMYDPTIAAHPEISRRPH